MGVADGGAVVQRKGPFGPLRGAAGVVAAVDRVLLSVDAEPFSPAAVVPPRPALGDLEVALFSAVSVA
jgi:hypothetical protein